MTTIVRINNNITIKTYSSQLDVRNLVQNFCLDDIIGEDKILLKGLSVMPKTVLAGSQPCKIFVAVAYIPLKEVKSHQVFELSGSEVTKSFELSVYSKKERAPWTNKYYLKFLPDSMKHASGI